jgi:hypothetical protein
LTGLVFGGVAIYTEFIRQDFPSLRFETLTDAGVLDVKERVADLQVTYKGVDIEKAGKALRVSVVRITNVGRDSITVNDYDAKIPFGISVHNGELVRAELITSTNQYLRTFLQVAVGGHTAVLTPVIWDPQDSVTLKLLILHDQGNSPRIEPVGKIARVSAFEIVDETAAQNENWAFVKRAFGGSAWIQVSRLVIYSLTFVVTLGLLVSLDEWTRRRKANRRKYQFLETIPDTLSSAQRVSVEPAIAFIRKHDMGTCREGMELLIGDLETLQKLYELSLRHAVADESKSFTYEQYLVHMLVQEGLIAIKGGKVHVIPEIVGIAESFLSFLKRRKRKVAALGN